MTPDLAVAGVFAGQMPEYKDGDWGLETGDWRLTQLPNRSLNRRARWRRQR
jgi:hypothetical protein